MRPAGPLVLLIEDCVATRLLYKHVLVEAGYRVVDAADGLDGVSKAQAQCPDLIITDLDMPIMDGFEAARQIRRDERTRGTPIVVLTGSPSRHCLVRAHDAGCDAYLTKPCPPKKLRDAIASLLRGRDRDDDHVTTNGRVRWASR